MKTRNCAGIGLVALAFVGLLGFAQPGQTQDNRLDHGEYMEMMQTCARACTDCQRAVPRCGAATESPHYRSTTRRECSIVLRWLLVIGIVWACHGCALYPDPASEPRADGE